MDNFSVVHVVESIPDAGGGTSRALSEIVGALVLHTRVRTSAFTAPLAPGDPTLKRLASHPEGTWVFAGPVGRLRAGGLGRAVEGRLNAAQGQAQGRVSVLHLHGLWCPDLVFAAAEGRARGIPTVWQPHGMLVREAMGRSRLKKALFKRLGLARELGHAAAVVFATDGELEGSDLSMLGEATRRVVVPLPVVPEVDAPARPELRARGRAALGVPAGAPVAVFLGRLHPVKRVELTLQAFAHAARGWAGAATGAARPVLALVGDGDAAYVRTLRAKAAALGIVENGVAPAPTGAGPVGVVRWAGWLAGEAKAAALCAADALVINSEFENFCYALVEACSAGTPVVMSDNLAMSAAAAGAGAGVATSATAEGLGEGLRRVWRAASAAESRGAEPAMGLAAAAWARERFAPAAVGGALDALYQAVATR